MTQPAQNLILALIKADMKSFKLIRGLENAGALTEDFYSDLERSILDLLDVEHAQRERLFRVYEVTLLYFWLNSQELAIERVKERVNEGGHNIPEQIIRRRYNKGIKNLINLFVPVVDNWMVIDNSENPFITVAEGQQGENMIIHDKNIWNRIMEISNE